MIRTLFIGYLWDGSTSIPRLEGLRAAGNDVTPFDAQAVFRASSRLATAVAHRTYCTGGVVSMNRRLDEQVTTTRPDVVWIEKGDWVYPATLRALRGSCGQIVHYNTDDIFGRRTWFWMHRRGLRLYDAVLTTNRHNVVEITSRFGVRALRAGMGYDASEHRMRDRRQNPGRDIVFIGHWEPHTESYVRALKNAGLPVRVWGHSWKKASDPALRSVSPLSQNEYVATIASSALALCSLSKGNRNESTGRSFEIPAIGTCMIAERTAEHEYLYGDMSGAALFSDESELVRRARELIEDAALREGIAQRGHARLIELGLSWQDHMCREWPMLERLLGGATLSAKDDEPFWPGFRSGAPFEPHVARQAGTSQGNSSREELSV